MSPLSGKISEKTPFQILSTTSIVPHFVFRFKENSKRFVLEILTKNLAFNLSGSLFLVGLGCSLKWWYKDQLLVALLKQNLPALSEPQQKISWETGEYILREQNRQFAENRGSTFSNLENLSSSKLPHSLADSIDFVNNARDQREFVHSSPFSLARQSTELLESPNDLNAVRFPIPDLKGTSDCSLFRSPLGERPEVDDWKTSPLALPSSGVNRLRASELHSTDHEANKTLDSLIERIDLYANHVVVKFNSPWEKHAYQRFVGVFSEPTQIAKFPSKHIQTNFISNSPENSIDQQSPKGESKVDTLSPFEKRFDSIEKSLLLPTVQAPDPVTNPLSSFPEQALETESIGSGQKPSKGSGLLPHKTFTAEKLGMKKSAAEQPLHFSSGKSPRLVEMNAPGILDPKEVSYSKTLQEHNKFYTKDKFGAIKEKFPKYTFWKPLYPAHWFKLSARGLCILNKDKDRVSDSPKGTVDGVPLTFLQPALMFPRENGGIWSCFGNSTVNSLNPLEPCFNFSHRGDSQFRQSWPVPFGANMSTGLIKTKAQKASKHVGLSTKLIGFSIFTPTCRSNRINSLDAVALHSVVLNTRLVELRARIEAFNALTVNHKIWNFENKDRSVKKTHDEGLSCLAGTYGLVPLKGNKLKALGDNLPKEKEAESQRGKRQNFDFSLKETGNGIANLSIKPVESDPLKGKDSSGLVPLGGKKQENPEGSVTSSREIGKLSYPLELTTTMAGWQPPIDTLILNSYLDEIPYKLENTLLVPPWKKKNKLLTPSNLSSHPMVPLEMEQNSPSFFDDQLSTPLTQLKKVETFRGIKSLEKTSTLVSSQRDKKLTLDERPSASSAKLPLNLRATAHQSDLSQVFTQPAHMVSSDYGTKTCSETFFKKLQLVEIKHLLKNELQSLANTLPIDYVDSALTFVDMPQSPVSSKKNLKPENFLETLQNSANSLLLLNNLGITFNSLSSLTTPPVLVPITNDASFWTWNLPVHMPYNAQRELDSGAVTLKTQMLKGDRWTTKLQSKEMNASTMTVPSYADSPQGGPGKSLAASQGPKALLTESIGKKSMDTSFHFDPNNFTWEILQQPSYNQHLLSSFPKGVQNNLKRKIVTKQEKCIKKIVLKQRKTTIAKIENINSVDKVINFANKKSRFMSGYVYPDTQSHSLKANFYRWIPLTKNALAVSQGDISATTIPPRGCLLLSPEGGQFFGTVGNTFHHSVQLINVNRQRIPKNVGGAPALLAVPGMSIDIPRFEPQKNKTLTKPLGMPLWPTRKELEIYWLLYPNSFRGVHRFIDKVSLIGVEIPTSPTTFLVRYLQQKPLGAYKLSSFLPTHPITSPLNLGTKTSLSIGHSKLNKPVGVNGFEQLKDQQQTPDMVNKIATKSAAAFPLLQKKINTISISLQSLDHVSKNQFAPKESRKKPIVSLAFIGSANDTMNTKVLPADAKVNKRTSGSSAVAADRFAGTSLPIFGESTGGQSFYPYEPERSSDQQIRGKEFKDDSMSTVPFHRPLIDERGQSTDLLPFSGFPLKKTANNTIELKNGIAPLFCHQEQTLVNPLELVTKSIGLNHHLAYFPGFTKPNQFFWSLNQIAQGDDKTFLKNVSPHPIESPDLLAVRRNADPLGVKGQKGNDKTLAFIGTANGTMESTNVGESANKSTLAGAGVNDGQGYKTAQTKKYFIDLSTKSIDCSPRKTAYQGIVVQRNTLTKDFQPPKNSRKQSSAWGTIYLGPENPLSNRQCHFFGQRRFSTIDTNDFQRDYLRQLGKETLAQSNCKAFTEKSTSVERTKILSFSKTVNSFFLKKRKYTYLLDEKDQWHLLFQEQLRAALEDPKKYPPLTPEEAKDHGPGRIKVSAPLMMARFPKRTAQRNGMRYLPFLTPNLIGIKGYGNNASELSYLKLTSPKIQQACLASPLGLLAFPLTGPDLLTVPFRGMSTDTSWRPLSCLEPFQLFTPRVGAGTSDCSPSEKTNLLTVNSFAIENPSRKESIPSSLGLVSVIDQKSMKRDCSEVNRCNFPIPKIVSHYPLFNEKDRVELHCAPWLNKNSLPIFHAANNLQGLTQEPLTIASWAILSQWSFLVALLLWIEQMLLGNVFPALFALEQLLLGATGLKSGDRTHVIRISQGDTPKFKDIAGVDGLLGELAELVLFLRGHRERLWNKKNSYGVLLTGPPGTGKTFLVRALANEARVPVLILSAGTLTVNKLNSNKPSWAIRHAFRRAKQLAPCILFIDEIDALGQSRGKIVTDINEIVADTNSGSPDLRSWQKQGASSTSIFPSEVLAYEQLQQNWPSVSKSFINEWQSSLKSTVLQEYNDIDRSSLCEDQLSDLWKSFENRKEAATTPGTYNNNVYRASDVELNANKTQPSDSFRGNANDAAQRENIKRKFGPLTQLLVSMDGVSNLSGVLIMGATNRPESLDAALTRPGRFERVIQVEKPAEHKRIEILQLYSHNLGVKDQIPWSYLANRTVGLTAADLAVAMNYSSLKAIVQGNMHTIETIEYGLDSIARFSNTPMVPLSFPLRGLAMKVNKPINFVDNSIDIPLAGTVDTLSSSIKGNLDRLNDKKYSLSAESGDLKSHEIKRLERLTQMAFFQAGKVVVQTLLPQHPPVALITLNLSGITTATSADTHIPIDGAFDTQWCSLLESRIIGLYGGKAASFLLECQQAWLPFVYPKTSQFFTQTPRDSKNQLSNALGLAKQSGVKEGDSWQSSGFALDKNHAPLVSWTDRTRLDYDFVLPNQKDVNQTLFTRGEAIDAANIFSEQKSACTRTGFQSDIGNLEVQSATRLATAMINKWAFYSLQCSNVSHLRPLSQKTEQISFAKKGYRGAIGTKALLMNKAKKVFLNNDRDNFLWQNPPSVPSLESYLRFLNLSERTRAHVSKQSNFTRETSISKNDQFPKMHVANKPSGEGVSNFPSSNGLAPALFHRPKVDDRKQALRKKNQASTEGYLAGQFPGTAVASAGTWKDNFASYKNATRADINEQQMPKVSQISLVTNANPTENGLQFAISQLKELSTKSIGFLQRGGKQRVSYSDMRISIQDVGERVSSRAEIFKLVNQFQLSNVQRDRFYPGWFRLYLPDIEATEFLKNVANYYFSLGLQTLIRPSLNEFARVRGHERMNLSYKSLEENDRMGNFLHSLELPLNEKNPVSAEKSLHSSAVPKVLGSRQAPGKTKESMNYVNTFATSSDSIPKEFGKQASPESSLAAQSPRRIPEPDGKGVIKGKPLDSYARKKPSSTSVFDSDKGFVKKIRNSGSLKNEIDNFQLHETSFCGIFDSNDDSISTVPVRGMSIDSPGADLKNKAFISEANDTTGGKTRFIALIKNVFLCCGSNNLSVGVGLLRSAANRRTQLNVKSQHFSKPRQISKKVYYPNISMAFWGFSRPWNMNRLINIGFRQDAIQHNVYNGLVIPLGAEPSKKSRENVFKKFPGGSGIGKKELFTFIGEANDTTGQQCIPKNQGQETWNRKQNENKSTPLADDKQGTKRTKQLAQLDVSFFLSLEKQIFPIGYNDVSVLEKEFLYHTLVNNCYAKAFFLVDENRQLIDYFADYLIRFQILRQHQILYLFSTVLLSCKKQL